MTIVKRCAVLFFTLVFVLCAIPVFAAAADVEYKDTIVVAQNSEPKDFDPDGAWGATEAIYSNHVHEGLVREGIDGKIIPLLAESWSLADDQVTWTFKLKPGVKFSNGTPVTGEDWIWSLERARDNPVSNSRTMATPIVKIEAPDETTLVITLNAPTASFLANLCKWNMVVKSKKHFEAIGVERFQREPMGTGPYSVAEWAQGQYIRYVANEYYHVEGKPYTKNLTYMIIMDDNTRLMQLQAGQVDIVPSLPFNMIDQISGNPDLVVTPMTGAQVRYINMDCTDEILKDERVRTALAYATDKQELVDLVALGYGEVSTAFISFLHGDFYNSSLVERGGNPERAKELLAEAGHPDGITLEVIFGSGAGSVYEQVATILKAQWEKAGINLVLNPLEPGTLVAKWEAVDYQLGLLQWTESSPDPNDIGAYECRYSDSKQWYSGMDDKALENLYFSTTSEMDREKRKELLWDLQQMVYDRCNIIPLFQAEYIYGATNKVEGLSVTPFNKIDSASIRVRK